MMQGGAFGLPPLFSGRHDMAALKQDITPNGLNQGDLVTLLGNMRDALNALRTDHNTLVAKLNADAGVTDTNYATTTAAAVKLTAG